MKAHKTAITLFLYSLIFLFSSVDVLGSSHGVGEFSGVELHPADLTLIDTVASERELIVAVVANQEKIYGDKDPVFEYTVTGFEPGDDEGILTGSLSREGGEDAGEYIITIGSLGATEKYSISFKEAVFKIKPKELWVEAPEGQSKVYGDDEPPLKYTAEGFVRGDDNQVLTGGLTREQGENTGEYAILQGGFEAGNNYTIVFEGASFEILPRPLSLANFRAENRAFDGTTEVNGTGFDDDRLTGDDLEYEYHASFSSPDAGNERTVNYTDIRIANGTDRNNYRLVTSEGIATADIKQREIKLAAAPVKIEYGELDPWLEWSITEGSLVEGDEITGDMYRTGGMDTGKHTIEQGTLTAGPNYKITFEQTSFEITPRELLVVADTSQTKVYGSIDPELTYNVTGFAPGDDSGMLSGKLSRKEGENAGEYNILPGTLNAGNNYEVTFRDALFEIIPKDLAITVKEGQTNVYGEDDPVFDYTADGFVPGEDYNVFRGRLSRRQGEDVGSYGILPGDLTAGKNYSLTFEGANFEITPRLLTVNVDAGQSKMFGENDPSLTFTASNFGWNDDERIISGSLSRVPGESSGFYEVSRNNLDAGKNYKIDFNEERFEVTYRPLVVTVDEGQSKTYGRNDPSFSFKVEGFVSGDNRSLLRGSLSRPEGEHAGEYPITIGNLATSGDYKIEFKGAVFEILPKRLNVSANRSQYKFVGDDDPDLSYKVSGFEFNDGKKQLKGSLSREDGEEIGEYQIERGSLDAGINYWVNFSGSIFYILMTPPEATTFIPVANKADATISTPIIVELDQPVYEADLSLISVTDSNHQSMPVEVTIEGETLQIEHDGLEYDTDYNIRIPFGSLRNADWVANNNIIWNFKTKILVPPQPVALSAPGNEQGTVNRNPVLSWNGSDMATNYRIQLSNDQNFDQIILDRREISDLSVDASVKLDYYTQYYWRVQASNSEGNSDWSEARSFTTVAEIPELLFPAMQTEGISIAPIFEWTTSYDNKNTRLQLSKKDTFGEIEIDTLLRDVSLQLTGLDDYQDYYWRVRVESEFSNSEWTENGHFQTRKGPADLDSEMVLEGFVDFGGSSSGGGDISSMDYRLMGLPGNDQHRVEDLFTGNYGTEWKAFIGGQSDNNQYEEYNPGDDRFVFTPGRGFWVLSKHALALELKINSVEANEQDAYTIDLKPGWNLISNPHRNSVSWNDVKEMNNIQGDLFGYNKYFVSVDSLRPVEGYYYYNDVDKPLTGIDIPFSSLQQRRGGADNAASTLENITSVSDSRSAKIYADFDSEMAFDVEVVYSIPEKKQGSFLKFYPSLEMSRHGMVLKDSAVESGGLLRNESEYDERGTKYQIELKGEVGSLFTWKTELTDLDTNTGILLVNPVTQRSWLLADDEKANATLTEPYTTYNLYIGDEHYLRKKQDSMLPVEISLEQNYPNPFNPTTQIRYSIPEQQHVRLEVYDIMGRRVHVIQDGMQQAGWHNVQFDGSNLSSGVYFYRLSTENALKTGRMTMIK
ncbi:hypothetical protein BH23BAC3_BH23BAC3_04480 [soil metagenome]